MKLYFLITYIFLSVQFHTFNCKPAKIVPKEEVATTANPDEITQQPWLKYLKNKKTTTVTPSPSTNTEPSALIKGRLGKAVNVERAVADTPNNESPPPQPPLNEMDQLANWLGIYLQPSGNILSDDRQQNPDSLYDEMYLDWMKRDLDSGTELSNNGPSNIAAPENLGAPLPPQPLPYGYPAVPMPYGYSPFFPSLAGFKMQKAMAQAQVDAAMAAFNITTTPKPLKLKLKITVPGNIDMTQLSQITTGLANSLPLGSTYEMA